MSLYQIKDWDAHFENSKSREYKTCSFVCVPNKQHGLSFSKIMAEKDGAMIYGIWCLILGACSQQKKRDGWLTVDGHQTGSPWTVEDLALKFRRPKSEIERSLQVFASQEIAWIILHDCPGTARSLPVECPDGIRKRRERIEENEGKEENQEVAKAPSLIKTFQEAWKTKFKEVNGKMYISGGLKEIGGIRSLLDSGRTIPQILEIAERAWKAPVNGKHQFERGHCFQIASFCSQFNKIEQIFGEDKAVQVRPSFQDAQAMGAVK